MTRSTWLAIRTSLPARRATMVKLASFLLPLALWALGTSLWLPEVFITEQGDTTAKPGLTEKWETFDANNVEVVKQPPQYRLTDKSLEAIRAAGVPEAVLLKLNPVKWTIGSAPYNDREDFFSAIRGNGPTDLNASEEKQYGDKIWEHLEGGKRRPAQGYRSSPFWLPAPHKVAIAFYKAFVTEPPSGDHWLHQSLWHSCQIIFWGFFFSAIIGVPLGILCGTFDLFSKLTEPFIDFIRYMPAPAFGVLCVALLGLDDGPKIAIIWIGTFFQMVLVVANTTRQFDESLLEAAQTLGATKRSLLTKVILPGILPSLYNDMRILLGWAWTYLIVAELIGASSGISHFIWMQGKYRRFENVYAGIIMIGIIGLTCDQILAGLTRFLFPWLPRKERGSGAWAAFFGALLWLPRVILGRGATGPAPRRPGSSLSPLAASRHSRLRLRVTAARGFASQPLAASRDSRMRARSRKRRKTVRNFSWKPTSQARTNPPCCSRATRSSPRRCATDSSAFTNGRSSWTCGIWARVSRTVRGRSKCSPK